MKKPKYAVVIALAAMTILAPAAVAQEETTIIEETTVYPEGAPSAGDTGGAATGTEDTGGAATGSGDTTGGTTGGGGSGSDSPGMAGDTMGSTTGGATTDIVKGATTDVGPLPTSGGPAVLAPAAALLLGSGIVTLAVLRRRRS